MDPLLPPLDGSLPTLPALADFHAEHNATLPWLQFPSKNTPASVISVTYAEMAKASHRVAHILRPGRSGPERGVVAMLVETDTVLYVGTVLGLMRAGCVVRELALCSKHFTYLACSLTPCLHEIRCKVFASCLSQHLARISLCILRIPLLFKE